MRLLQHTAAYKDTDVVFEAMELEESFFVYMGLVDQARMRTLEVAMPHSSGETISTVLLNEQPDAAMGTLAKRLAKRCGCVVHLSSGMPIEGELSAWAEKQLIIFLKEHCIMAG